MVKISVSKLTFISNLDLYFKCKCSHLGFSFFDAMITHQLFKIYHSKFTGRCASPKSWMGSFTNDLDLLFKISGIHHGILFWDNHSSTV